MESNSRNNYKITTLWKQKLLRKIFLDILGNSQFRLCKYIKKDFCNKIDSLITSHIGCTDQQIYDEMYTWIHNCVHEKTKKLILQDNNNYRSNNRAEKIYELIKKYLNTSDSPLNILDIGCASGAITVMVGKYMNLEPQNVHGCDIENLSENNPYQQQFTFTHINEQCANTLPYEDDSYHVVLALMSLHHIVNKLDILHEIYRILKPGGLLIIREHHCIDSNLALVLDVVHGFYSMVWANPREMNTFDDYFASYTHSDVLTNTLKSLHFTERYNNHMLDYPRFHKGKIINPLSYYYAAYEKT